VWIGDVLEDHLGRDHRAVAATVVRTDVLVRVLAEVDEVGGAVRV